MHHLSRKKLLPTFALCIALSSIEATQAISARSIFYRLFVCCYSKDSRPYSQFNHQHSNGNKEFTNPVYEKTTNPIKKGEEDYGKPIQRSKMTNKRASDDEPTEPHTLNPPKS